MIENDNGIICCAAAVAIAAAVAAATSQFARAFTVRIFDDHNNGIKNLPHRRDAIECEIIFLFVNCDCLSHLLSLSHLSHICIHLIDGWIKCQQNTQHGYKYGDANELLGNESFYLFMAFLCRFFLVCFDSYVI